MPGNFLLIDVKFWIAVKVSPVVNLPLIFQPTIASSNNEIRMKKREFEAEGPASTVRFLATVITSESENSIFVQSMVAETCVVQRKLLIDESLATNHLYSQGVTCQLEVVAFWKDPPSQTNYAGQNDEETQRKVPASTHNNS